MDPEELKISCDIVIKVLPAVRLFAYCSSSSDALHVSVVNLFIVFLFKVLQKFNSTCERLVGKCKAHNASADQEMMGMLEVCPRSPAFYLLYPSSLHEIASHGPPVSALV